MKDVEVPEWKKKALEAGKNLDASAAPFGMSWGTESTISATDAYKKVENVVSETHDHGQSHDHGHSHEHMDHPGKYDERPSSHDRDWEERSFTVGLGGPVGSGESVFCHKHENSG